MGIFERIKSLFKLPNPNEDPERLLNSYIEMTSERLRELTVAISKAESDRLSAITSIHNYEQEIAYLRKDAEQACLQQNEIKARSFLEQEHVKKQLLEKKKASLLKMDEMMEPFRNSYSTIKEKLNQAKANRDLLMLRGRTAIDKKKLQEIISASSDEAIEYVRTWQDKILLLEAEEEVSKVSSLSIDEEFEQLLKTSKSRNTS
ncbi:PspA/IM30 family protein [Paenibacillus ginsengarvi]|uniref:PspA/IM30 family protein n=1 Tax=Paenibacillus ginsengarvi TaxID=400777 RepID=A0A3B0CFQ9_9BACL|nr:PspA/IM30 family protein [Paenibacillus ginsengarvi]RKN81966.1 hypothetical protein D7M11_18480 [Paenibacillus ginsengarvi]